MKKYLRQSHKKVIAICSSNISEKCVIKKEIQYRDYMDNKDRNNDEYICLFCSRKEKYTGRNNPNVKYETLDDSFFSDINTEEKAYILGWIASDGSISKSSNSITINLSIKDLEILENIRDMINEELPIKIRMNGKIVNLTICSSKMKDDVCNLLTITPGKKDTVVRLPKIDTLLIRHFIRGYFDGDGTIRKVQSGRIPECKISSNSKYMKQEIADFFNIPYHIKDNELSYSGINAIDFLFNLYENSRIYLKRKKKRYLKWCNYVPSLSGRGNYGKEKYFRWTRTRDDAVPPKKTRASDSGYDITIIEKIKVVGTVHFYTTGIKVKPEYGWYFEMVPRSSISKTGYILANSVGTIDQSYVGEVIVALMKIDSNAKDLELPCRITQLIPRPIIHKEFLETDDIEETDRGDGGFGSTGK